MITLSEKNSSQNLNSVESEKSKESHAVIYQKNKDHGGKAKSWRKLRWFLVVLLLTGGGIYLWDLMIKERYIAKRFGVVVPGKVFRSGQISAFMLEPTIKDNHLQVIIDLNGLESGPLKRDQEAEMEISKQLSIEHYRYPLKGDGTGNVEHYVDALEKIQQSVLAGKPVLVHCAAGAQRTGGVIACYQMLFEGKSPSEARSEIDKYETRTWKNRTMITYVNENMPTICQKLYERKLINKIPDKFPQLEVPK